MTFIVHLQHGRSVPKFHYICKSMFPRAFFVEIRTVEAKLHSFLTLAIDGDEWSASCPILFTPGGKISRYLLNRTFLWGLFRAGQCGDEINF